MKAAEKACSRNQHVFCKCTELKACEPLNHSTQPLKISHWYRNFIAFKLSAVKTGSSWPARPEGVRRRQQDDLARRNFMQLKTKQNKSLIIITQIYSIFWNSVHTIDTLISAPDRGLYFSDIWTTQPSEIKLWSGIWETSAPCHQSHVWPWATGQTCQCSEDMGRSRKSNISDPVEAKATILQMCFCLC